MVEKDAAVSSAYRLLMLASNPRGLIDHAMSEARCFGKAKPGNLAVGCNQDNFYLFKSAGFISQVSKRKTMN
jgi:hypothetical protein